MEETQLGKKAKFSVEAVEDTISEVGRLEICL